MMALDWIPYNFNDVINLKGSAYFPKVLIGIRDLRLMEVVEKMALDIFQWWTSTWFLVIDVDFLHCQFSWRSWYQRIIMLIILCASFPSRDGTNNFNRIWH